LASPTIQIIKLVNVTSVTYTETPTHSAHSASCAVHSFVH